MTKQPLHKAIGWTSLNWSELEEVLLDTEINLNRHLLTYVEDALQYPILLPNSMLPGRQTAKLDKYPDIDDIAPN